MQRMGMCLGPEARARRGIQAAARRGLARDLGAPSRPRTFATIRSSSRNRRTSCSDIGNITAAIFATDAAAMAAGRAPTPGLVGAFAWPWQEPFATRKPGEWWAMMDEVFHLD